MKMVKHNKTIIILGAIMLLASLMWMFEPYYTWAQDNGHPCRVALDPEVPLFEPDNMNPGDTEESTVTVTKTGSASAELYFAWEYIAGNPVHGEDGSLFDQLEMEILSGETVLFEGLMNEWEYDRDNPSMEDAVNITDELEMDFMEQGDEITLDFKIYLPGPETGNEYQGATLETRLVFFTICTNGDDPPPPPPPDEPEINIEKATNGIDADAPTGPNITVGDTVTWTYVVTNPGDVPLSSIEVTDNIDGVNPEYVSGDENEDGILDLDETWIFEAEGVAEEGQYANIGSVEGTSEEGETVTADDPSHYIGVATPVEDEFPPEEPAVEPEPEEDTVIIDPESPKTDPGLPKTDGVSIGLFIFGILLILAGMSLRRSMPEET